MTLLPRTPDAHVQATQLSDLILKKTNELDAAEEAKEFVCSRFEQRMEQHLKVAPWQGRLFFFFSVLSISAGVASSTLGASGSAKSGAVIALGLIVAASTAINQIAKFGQKSAIRFRAGNGLRREAWDYVMGQGRYEHVPDAEQQFRLFYNAIWEIERPADLTVEVSAEGGQQGAG